MPSEHDKIERERHHHSQRDWSPRADRRDGEECAVLTFDARVFPMMVSFTLDDVA